MLVGITYDLKDDYLGLGFSEKEVAEFDCLETIEAIEGSLRRLGFDTARIGNIRELTLRLARGERWDLVFNIAEGLAGYGREAQVPALLDAHDIPYTFSDPLVLSLTLHKGLTKRVIRDLGIPTPDFCVVESEADIPRVALPYPLFAKPVAEGTSKGITAESRIENFEDLFLVCKGLLSEFRQPVLVERYLPGREFTVGVVGTGERARAIGVMEVIFRKGAEAGGYSYQNKKLWERLIEYRRVDNSVAETCKRLALDVWRGLGCRDGGRVDLRADERGRPQFIEVNPLAGLNPTFSDFPILAGLAGHSYLSLIDDILQSALERTNLDLMVLTPPAELWRVNESRSFA